MFDEVRMSERAWLAKVASRNRLWFQISRFHRNVPAWTPQISYEEEQNTINVTFYINTNVQANQGLVKHSCDRGTHLTDKQKIYNSSHHPFGN